MASKYFAGANHAALYSQFRPLPSPKLIEEVLRYLRKKEFSSLEFAVDVGCGSGQSTHFFAPHFRNVLGIDVSEAQIQEATKKNLKTNVSFKIGTAEKIPVPDQSVQLVTASQSCHWFNLPLFYDEVKRVLVPNGVLALYGYNFPSLHWKNKTDELTASLLKIYREDTKGFWGAERALVDDEYKNEIFNIPFSDVVRSNNFHYEQSSTVKNVAGYVESWSGFQMYKKNKGSDAAQNLIDGFIETLLKIMDETNPDTAELTLKFPFFLIMGRKSTN